MNLTELAVQHQAWSRATFPNDNAYTGLKKLDSEVAEIWDAIANRSDFGCAEEYADAIMCLFSSAAHLGVTSEMITAAFAEKLEINKRRKWRRNADGASSHIKDEVELKASPTIPELCPKCGHAPGVNPLTCDCLPF